MAALKVPTITLVGTPWKQGARQEIQYSGRPGTVLYLDWDPAGSPTSVTVGANGKAYVTVPNNATSVIVSDPQGGAAPVGTTCGP